MWGDVRHLYPKMLYRQSFKFPKVISKFTFISGSSMEVDITSINRKGLKNEHGNYPKWMSQRKVRKVKRREKKRDKRKKK